MCMRARVCASAFRLFQERKRDRDRERMAKEARWLPTVLRPHVVGLLPSSFFFIPKKPPTFESCANVDRLQFNCHGGKVQYCSVLPCQTTMLLGDSSCLRTNADDVTTSPFSSFLVACAAKTRSCATEPDA